MNRCEKKGGGEELRFSTLIPEAKRRGGKVGKKPG